MVYIDKVHYEMDNQGFEFISTVKWTINFYENATQESTKKQMIDFINKNPNCTKTKYVRNGFWTMGEDVRVVANQYLRTDANHIAKDNLENLPRY